MNDYYSQGSQKPKDKDVFEKIGPKNSFFFGLGSGVAGFFIIGFFILLGVFLTSGIGGGNGRTVKADPNPSIAPNPTQPEAGPIELELSDDDWIRGDKNAKITIVEYSDFDCPFCTRHHATMKQILEAYPKDVNWVYRHFPLAQLHPNAEKKARAAECVGSLAGADAFWKFSDSLFDGEEGGTDAELGPLAAAAGANQSKFLTCLANEDFADVVDNDTQTALSAGGSGTPYNVIVAGDQRIPVNGAVPFEQFKSIIDSLL